jgi:hypothetical protein
MPRFKGLPPTPSRVKTTTTTTTTKTLGKAISLFLQRDWSVDEKGNQLFPLCPDWERERERPVSLLTSCYQWQTFGSAVTGHLQAHRFNLIQIAAFLPASPYSCIMNFILNTTGKSYKTLLPLNIYVTAPVPLCIGITRTTNTFW